MLVCKDDYLVATIPKLQPAGKMIYQITLIGGDGHGMLPMLDSIRATAGFFPSRLFKAAFR